MADGYSVSLFTTWRRPDVEQLWRKERVTAGDGYAAADAADGSRFGAVAATRNLHPIAELSADPCTEQMGVAGSVARAPASLPHGLHPEQRRRAAVRAVRRRRRCSRRDANAPARLGDVLAPVLKISEVRAVAADRLWLSPCHGRATIAFHFTWIPSWPEVRPVLAAAGIGTRHRSLRDRTGASSRPSAAAPSASRFEQSRRVRGARRRMGSDRKVPQWLPRRVAGLNHGETQAHARRLGAIARRRVAYWNVLTRTSALAWANSQTTSSSTSDGRPRRASS